jgi:threonine dehydrogenase-like Zn-dependent dehydrogenase
MTVNTRREDFWPIVQNATGGIGADLVMIAVPSPGALQEALALARGDGRVVVFGGVPKGSKAELDPNIIHYREVTITGAFNCTVEEFRQAVEIACDLPLDAVVTHRVPLTRVMDGFEIMAAKSGLKVLVAMRASELDE